MKHYHIPPIYLYYTVDLVYSPEIVDKSIIGSVRLINKVSGTVDYVKDGKLVFRTHTAEKDRLVFQLGSADPNLALQAALTVQDDVAAFDLNCGCPKRFSLQTGMGAALLKTPNLLIGILESLLAGTRRPVSAKIRLFLAEEGGNGSQTFFDTHSLLQRIIETGVSAVAIHARDPIERSDKHPAHWNLFRNLAQTVRNTNIALYGSTEIEYTTLILNGDVGLKDSCSYEPDFSLKRIMTESFANSVMSARAVQWNPLCLAKIKKALFGTEIKNLDESMLSEIFADAPASRMSARRIEDGLLLVDLLAETGLFQSKGAARKEIPAGGVYLNNERVTEPQTKIERTHLISGKALVLRKGKKNYHVVRFED
ncbi:MAG: hypothetical protein EBX52_09440 [Proteobacteria bacterium]|nr:hypothetical protein [Pseudomonadota bacterium]